MDWCCSAPSTDGAAGLLRMHSTAQTSNHAPRRRRGHESICLNPFYPFPRDLCLVCRLHGVPLTLCR